MSERIADYDGLPVVELKHLLVWKERGNDGRASFHPGDILYVKALVHEALEGGQSTGQVSYAVCSVWDDVIQADLTELMVCRFAVPVECFSVPPSVHSSWHVSNSRALVTGEGNISLRPIGNIGDALRECDQKVDMQLRDAAFLDAMDSDDEE